MRLKQSKQREQLEEDDEVDIEKKFYLGDKPNV
jgi:hypothetical protein